MTCRDTGAILDDAARDELAVKHLDLVPRVVGRLPYAPPPGMDHEDLVSVGTIGLLKAARTYQPMRGAAFRTFAYLSIRAAILDELRRQDHLPRGVRSRLKELRRAEEEFRGREGRLPTPQEAAELLATDVAEVAVLLAHAEEDRLLAGHGAPQADLDEPRDEAGGEPGELAARREELALVERAIQELPKRERQVIVLYHSEGLYLKEIGELLGVTESRICQILACAQRKLRARLDQERSRRHEP